MTLAPNDCRDAFVDIVTELADRGAPVCIVLNDSVSSTKTKNFQDRFPDRLINVGIAEQNLIGVSAGLANTGMVPFACAASCFLTSRAFEQIKIDVGYSLANVKLSGFSPGFAYGALGPTHHATEDIALIRAVPGLKIVAPSTPAEMRAATLAAYETEGPVYLRIPRGDLPEFFPSDQGFEFGKSVCLKDGQDVLLLSYGYCLKSAEKASKLLKRLGISVHLINTSSLEPLDQKSITQAAKRISAVVTVEDHSIRRGLGSAVLELLAEQSGIRILRLGVEERFATTGSTEELAESFGLQAEAISHRVQKFLQEVV